ncbi:unnamed protein product [Anisakis simplex]|uniref:Ataxin-10 n=1 Tax=Anisakis simplex TaxID=6269 RepID=A0A0M3K1I8_ANISI|nr:unnamed protein product [Anisakis simplex]
MDQDEVIRKHFDHVFVDRQLDLEALTGLRKYFAVNTESASLLETLKEEHLTQFIRDVFEAVMEGFDEDGGKFKTLDDEQKRFRKVALQCLVNAANRSERLRESIEEDSIRYFRAMLRLEYFKREVLACLVAFAKPLHKKSVLCSEYSDLLNDIAQLWSHQSTTANERSWISALIAIYLEEDYAFLADCFADMDANAFSELLVIVETLVDHSETGHTVPYCYYEVKHMNTFQVHSNNVRFCMNLLERIQYEIGEVVLSSTDDVKEIVDRSEMKLKFDTIDVVNSLISIIASMALRRPQFDAILHNDTTATCLVIRSLEAVVDCEIVKENALPHIPKAHDRPVPPKQTRREAIKLPFVDNFSRLLRCDNVSAQQIASLKSACVQAIGNLCCESELNQNIVGEHDGVILLLHCARRLDTDSPFLMQWAIAALRYVCMGCPQNQQRLASIEQVTLKDSFEILIYDKFPSAVIDRDRLLAQLGLRAVIVPDTGKIRLEKIE